MLVAAGNFGVAGSGRWCNRMMRRGRGTVTAAALLVQRVFVRVGNFCGCGIAVCNSGTRLGFIM